MSTSSGAADASPAEEAEAHAHGHPEPRDYVRIFGILFVLTLLEVLASYVAMPQWLFISGLTGMAVAKFALVVGFYMHLKFDSRMFRRLFVFGIILAVTVFMLVLALFFWIGPTYTAAAN